VLGFRGVMLGTLGPSDTMFGVPGRDVGHLWPQVGPCLDSLTEPGAKGAPFWDPFCGLWKPWAPPGTTAGEKGWPKPPRNLTFLIHFGTLLKDVRGKWDLHETCAGVSGLHVCTASWSD